MIRLHTPQRRCIVFRMAPMSAMGGGLFPCLEAQPHFFSPLLGWTTYSNYLRMINSTKGIRDECVAIRGAGKSSVDWLLVARGLCWEFGLRQHKLWLRQCGTPEGSH